MNVKIAAYFMTYLQDNIWLKTSKFRFPDNVALIFSFHYFYFSDFNQSMNKVVLLYRKSMEPYVVQVSDKLHSYFVRKKKIIIILTIF